MMLSASSNRFKTFQTERDRIVRERDSMRIMCDRLRQDRDNTVNELIKAKKESDEMKKQRNQAFNDLKTIRWVFCSIFRFFRFFYYYYYIWLRLKFLVIFSYIYENILKLPFAFGGF